MTDVNKWQQPVYEVPPPEAPDMHFEDERDELKTQLAASEKAIEAAQKGIQSARRTAICAIVVAVVVSIGSVVAAVLISLAVRESTDEYVLLTRINSLSDEVDSHSGSLTALDDELDSMTEAVAGLDTTTDTLSADLATMSTVVSGHTSSLSSVSADVSALEVATTAADADITALSASVSALEGDLSTLTTTTSTLSADLSTVSDTVTAQTASLSSLGTDVTAVQSDVTALAVYADPNASYSDVKTVLMEGVTVNAPFYIRSTHTTADEALSAVRASYTGVTVWETVEKSIADVRFSSAYTSTLNEDYQHAFTLRQKGLTGTGCWAASHCVVGQYAMVVFDTPTLVCAIATAGRPLTSNQYVKTYEIEYYDADQDEWVSVVDGKTSFQGNSDMNTVVLHTLSEPVVADRVRISVLTWNTHISMRLEVYGWQ
ncbi:hypothetical protein KIPB_009322 [Kipferlia bialata]|uniref:F5/8 type C domain-containing protein n=1 Tax=Kipferlia bialata TaxID=797122 RepID=A0A9K3D439_9EUKA|nr:hypothetical protein KIPB_009322 [Kipferlia bialata]|eukprot:g9322.t1